MGDRTPKIDMIKDANGFDMNQVNDLRMEVNEINKKIDKLTAIVTNIQSNQPNGNEIKINK